MILFLYSQARVQGILMVLFCLGNESNSWLQQLLSLRSWQQWLHFSSIVVTGRGRNANPVLTLSSHYPVPWSFPLFLTFELWLFWNWNITGTSSLRTIHYARGGWPLHLIKTRAATLLKHTYICDPQSVSFADGNLYNSAENPCIFRGKHESMEAQMLVSAFFEETDFSRVMASNSTATDHSETASSIVPWNTWT